MKYSAICAVAAANWYFCSSDVNMVSQKKLFTDFCRQHILDLTWEDMFFTKIIYMKLQYKAIKFYIFIKSKFTTKIYQFFGGG